MNWFRNMKIKAKMIVSFMLVIVLMLAFAVVAFVSLADLDTMFNLAINSPMKVKECVLRLQVNFREARYSAIMVSTYTGADADACEKNYNDAKASIDETKKWLDEYRKTVNNNPKYTSDERSTRLTKASSIETLLGKYSSDVLEPLIAAARASDEAQSLQIIRSTTVPADIKSITTDLLDLADKTSTTYINNAEASAAFSKTIMIVIAVAATLIAIIIALYVASLISNLLIPMSAFMDKAGTTGDLTKSADDLRIIGKYLNTKDEMGKLTTSIVAFLKRIEDVARSLEMVSSGDLTAECEPLSDKDTLGISLKKMTENLNEMFGEINTSATQVSIGAKQVADGSQSLAQGATEQAASIEELSSSVSEISQKTRNNADMAGRAAALANTIMDNAGKGSRQMEEMTSAVRDINAASQGISKVIKVIDDIAFQTNILALNAAVEAARAGQHGKGFAVVAEEVRNLAAKSAKAAKETGDMIQNSMEKAEMGSRIVGETAESLAEIVSGINESSDLVKGIAKSSEDQSLGIAQINIGIDQVSQVIQQNSATAQESAAASEEMSGQSDILGDLISRFKLKDGASSKRNMTQQSRTAKRLPQSAMPKKGFAMTNVGDTSGFGKY